MKQIGRYNIIEELGQGAMGAVYRASDPMMDRVVAVKTILATALSGPLAADYRERFFREARAAGRLAHPGIVTVYDVAEQEGTPYLVMEFIHGQTLEKIMESGERFDADRVMELGQQIAEALDYAHKGGVIHRDIKPANIMITADGRPKIADFGVAKLSGAQVTTTGQLMGTPAFMAPEQFTGAPIDGRADLFALGVVLYWLATGDRPFTGETLMAMSYKIVHTNPVPPRKLNPAIPRDLENVILKCMEKDPAARYQSGDALAKDLRAMREGRALETLSRERAARVANIEKTELSVPTPADDSFDTAETVAVLKPSPRMTASPVPAVRAGATVPTARNATVAAPPATVSEPPARRSGSQAWMVFATIVVVATLAAWALKKRENVIVMPPQQAQQQPAPTNEPAGIPTPPAPGAVVEPPDATKAKADALRAAEDAKKRSAKTAAAAKHVTGLNLDFTATERAMVVLTPDGGPAANYQMQPGNSVSAKADKEMKLFTDNAGALQWKMNGKSQPALGTGHTALTARITETGAETIWSGDPAAMAKKYRQFGPGKIPEGGVPSMPPVVDPERIRSDVAKQLKTTMAFLKIEVQAPVVLDVKVTMDGKPIFHRAAALDVAAAETDVKRNPGERWVLPGKHDFEVHVSRPGARGRWNQTVAGDFSVGQQRILHVRMRPLNQPNILNQLSVEIE